MNMTKLTTRDCRSHGTSYIYRVADKVVVWKYCGENDTFLEHREITGLYCSCYGMIRLYKYIVTSRRNSFTNYKTDTQVTGMKGFHIKAILDW